MSASSEPGTAAVPRATYRLQLGPGFGFAEAAEIADYLAELGVSHAYLSPILQAAPGSTHGYDVVNPQSLNPELGGAEGYERLSQALKRQGISQLLDIVPNHMAIGPSNPWWWDVLENGPSSLYADFFDVDWSAPEERLRDKVMLPVLGDHSGRLIEAGEIQLTRQGPTFTVRYHEHSAPAGPRSLAEILSRAAARAASAELAFIAEAHDALPLATARTQEAKDRRHRDKEVLKGLLGRLIDSDPEIAAAIDTEVAAVNADADALDAFLLRQNYRLAYWRAAARDLGYRRFFDVSTLAGTSVEKPHVFRATHAKIEELVARGLVHGLRVDHIDGLKAPADYLRRLRALAGSGWILVEKILGSEEELPPDWPVDGTTGYDFLNQVGGLFVDASALPALNQAYAAFTSAPTDFPAIAREKKRQVLNELLGSDLNRLTAQLLEVCEKHRRFRDYSRHEVHEVLREVLACFPVYRSYVDAERGRVEATDLRVIQSAVGLARRERPELDGELFELVERVLSLTLKGELEGELAARFQQTSGPVMAKGVEDTAFYCYLPLVALNEVGGEPDRPTDVESFHRACQRRLERYPRALLATSTHDTKRGEDARARLALLSEMPEAWAAAVQRWSAHNERHRQDGMPSRNAEYLLYQTLVGAFPLEAERAAAYLLKAAREEKQQTRWTEQNQRYETALVEFTQRVLGDPDFLADFERFLQPLIEPGRVNSLSQTLIKLTSPGVPDFYQGSELWDHQLVDPDNRRPVDYAARRSLLAASNGLTPERALSRSHEGLSKLWLIRSVLALRRRAPQHFAAEAAHLPLFARGRYAQHVVAYGRGPGLVVITQRLPLSRGSDWDDTTLELPEASFRDALSNEPVAGGTRALRELLARFPVCLLEREPGIAER
jgi:(1->4)-alpha-D-glucan 1-alpha-D-glucosylmutase